MIVPTHSSYLFVLSVQSLCSISLFTSILRSLSASLSPFPFFDSFSGPFAGSVGVVFVYVGVRVCRGDLPALPYRSAVRTAPPAHLTAYDILDQNASLQKITSPHSGMTT